MNKTPSVNVEGILSQSLRAVLPPRARPNDGYAFIKADAERFQLCATGPEMGVRLDFRRDRPEVQRLLSGQGEHLVGSRDLTQALKALRATRRGAVLALGEALELRRDGVRLRPRSPQRVEPQAVLSRFEGEAEELCPPMPVENLLEPLERVLYARSREEYRAVLRGVKLELVREQPRLVAADGYRLAVAMEGDKLIRENRFGQGWLLWGHEAEALAGLLRKAPRSAELRLRERGGDLRVEVRAESEGWGLVAFLTPMEGEYPDYWRAVPAAERLRLALDRRALAEALRPLVRLSDRPYRRIDLAASGEGLLLSAEGDRAEARSELPVLAAWGQPVEQVALNGDYLLEAVENAPGETVHLVLSGDGKTPVCVEKDGYLAVFPPLRV